MMYYKERFKDFFAIDELLCLQLIGYSDADICHSFYSRKKKRLCKKQLPTRLNNMKKQNRY